MIHMTWKDFPHWLKGGIIGLLLLILINVIYYFLVLFGAVNLVFMLQSWGIVFVQSTFLIILIYLIVFFLVGSLIGWIYGMKK